MFNVGDAIKAKCGSTRRVVVATNGKYTVVRSHDWHFARVIENEALERYWEHDTQTKGSK